MALKTLGSVAVGTVVKIKENSLPVEFIIVHQGKPGAMYDDSCNGTWVVRKDIYSNMMWRASSGSTSDDYENNYAIGTAHTWLNSSYLTFIDEKVRAEILQVKIPYRPGGGLQNTVYDGANGLSCKAFLLSGTEVGIDNTLEYSFTIPTLGTLLSYFEHGYTSSSQNKRISRLNGEASPWWTRSPSLNNYPLFALYISKFGQSNLYDLYEDPQERDHTSYNHGIRPTFVLNSNIYVDENNNVITNEPPTAPGSINVSGVVSGGTATITLTAATDPDGTVENYIYERSIDGSDFVQFAKVNSLTQTDTISEEWGTVAYRACAVDDADATGPYVTSETETINSGWVLIGGPVSNLGVKSEQFDFKATIGVSGETGITDIAVVAKLDGNQVYDDLVDQNEVVTIPIDTRTFGEGQHELQVIASKEDLLSAAAVYVFTVPSIALPSGGYAMQFEDEYGNPIFPVGSARFILGENGMSVQAEVNMLRNAHRGLTGHLSFIDALLGPATKEYDRQANVTYAMQSYDPINGSSLGGLRCIYPTFNGALSTLLNATTSKLSFTVPANAIISLYKYVLDTLPDVSPDLTVNFIALSQPRVLSAATNAGNTSTDLQDALKQIMKAFSTWNYYAILDPENATTYYVASQAEITDDTPNASNVAYVSSANPNKWYQGVSMTFLDTSNVEGLFTYLNPPLIVSATSANSVSTGTTLNDTLIAMIKAQPTYYRYLMEDRSGDLYYVLSATQLTADSTSAANVLYCTTGGTYYNGESLTLVSKDTVLEFFTTNNNFKLFSIQNNPQYVTSETIKDVVYQMFINSPDIQYWYTIQDVAGNKAHVGSATEITTDNNTMWIDSVCIAKDVGVWHKDVTIYTSGKFVGENNTTDYSNTYYMSENTFSTLKEALNYLISGSCYGGSLKFTLHDGGTYYRFGYNDLTFRTYPSDPNHTSYKVIQEATP